MIKNKLLRARQTRLVQKADLNPVRFLSELKNDNVIPKSTQEAIKDKKIIKQSKQSITH